MQEHAPVVDFTVVRIVVRTCRRFYCNTNPHSCDINIKHGDTTTGREVGIPEWYIAGNDLYELAKGVSCRRSKSVPSQEESLWSEVGTKSLEHIFDQRLSKP